MYKGELIYKITLQESHFSSLFFSVYSNLFIMTVIFASYHSNRNTVEEILSAKYKYANCVYFVIVATEFFTNWNAIEGLARGDFRRPCYNTLYSILIS